MKKYRLRRKLTLHRETLRQLTTDDMRNVAGGIQDTRGDCSSLCHPPRTYTTCPAPTGLQCLPQSAACTPPPPPRI